MAEAQETGVVADMAVDMVVIVVVAIETIETAEGDEGEAKVVGAAAVLVTKR